MKNKHDPKLFKVLSVEQITPNMKTISIGGPAINSFPASEDAAHIKLFLSPIEEGVRSIIRTYTIRRRTSEKIDIEFALHGDSGEGGPAVKWATNAKPGDEILVGGPGTGKPLLAGAQRYLVVGDMTALPAIAVNLEKLDKGAKGDVVIEVQSKEDKRELEHPEGVKLHWVYNPNPGENADAFEEKVRSIVWPSEEVYVWSATEFDMMRRMRSYFIQEKGVRKDQIYISSYWKKGINEEAHKKVKREDATANSM